jgi:predicted CoA-binding protein
MPERTVAVIGASADRSKFGNKAVRAYHAAGWTVFPVHPALPRVEGIPAHASLDTVPADELERVSFYVPPSVGIHLLDAVARKRVGEVWLNPGSDSPALSARAAELGLHVIRACSIIAAGQDPSNY